MVFLYSLWCWCCGGFFAQSFARKKEKNEKKEKKEEEEEKEKGTGAQLGVIVSYGMDPISSTLNTTCQLQRRSHGGCFMDCFFEKIFARIPFKVGMESCQPMPMNSLSKSPCKSSLLEP